MKHFNSRSSFFLISSKIFYTNAVRSWKALNIEINPYNNTAPLFIHKQQVS